MRRFLLASGSLKGVAKEYGISYPTVRLRLDRLIDKVRLLTEEQFQDEFERELRIAHAEGRIDHETLRRLQSAHERSVAGDG